MRKLFFLAFILCVALLLNGCGKKEGTGDKKEDKTEQKSDQKKDISFSEGSIYHIKYEAKSGNDKGTMDFYFKNKNARIEMNFTEGEKKNNAKMFYADKVVYMITEMEGKKIGMKMDLSESKEADMEIVNVKEKLKEYEKIGTDDVLGYKCDVYKTKEGSKLSIYKEAFALKVIDSKNNEFVATAFEQDVKLADDFFTAPKDVEYMDFSKLGNIK